MKEMTKTKNNSRSRKSTASGQSFDGVYLLKILLYLFLGSLWIKVSNATSVTIAVPIGLIIGLAFTTHEHFRIDRKIEYAVLLVAMLFGYFASYGLYINF